MRKIYIGDFEKYILKTIMNLGNNVFVIEIHEDLASKLDRDFSYSALYTAMERLRKKGYLTSILHPSMPVRGGREKRSFSVTAKGMQALDVALWSLRQLGM